MKIAIIGIGYVGLALLKLFRNKLHVIGYDRNKNRIKNVSNGKFNLTSKFKDISDCSVYIVTLPTPVNKKNKPDLKNLIEFTERISNLIKKGDIIIYESTYAPFTTNNIFKKILEKKTKLKENRDFFICYSPERINPGTSLKEMRNVTKLVSSNSKKITKLISSIYKKGFNEVYECSTIEIAESSKIIENIQRDINIAYFNELSKIFIGLSINPKEVFKSASTKWNFINMKPGLVGGHCLPVDPYYFTNYIQKKNLKSEFLISGRKINEDYVKFLTKRLFSFLNKNKQIRSILFLGCTYKADVADFRTSKSIKLINNFLNKKKLKVKVYDPYLQKENSIYKKRVKNLNNFDLVIKLVNHKIFSNIKNIKIIDFTDIDSVFNLIK